MKRSSSLLLLGVVLVAAAFYVLAQMDRGLSLPAWQRLATGLTAAAGALLIVFTVLVKLGVVSDELLAGIGEPSLDGGPTLKVYFTVYGGLTAASVVPSLLLYLRYHISPYAALAVIWGAIFVIAAVGWPRWLFGTIRRTGWFVAVRSDSAMRVVLVLLGAMLAALGLAGHAPGAPSN